MAKTGRKANAVPSVEWKLYLPEDLAAEVSLLLEDPLREKMRYGARGELMESLLRKWVEEKRKEMNVSEEGGSANG
jgi:hypothetical protein